MAFAPINSVELSGILDSMNGNYDSSACKMKGECVLKAVDQGEGRNLELEMDAITKDRQEEEGVEGMDFWSRLVAEEQNENPENLWMYALDQFDKRLTKIEQFLSMDGDKKPDRPSKNISRDQMIEAVVASIKELSSSNFGIGKSLIKKYVSERLGIDLVNSHYYQKRLNVIIKYALSQNLFSYDKETHLFKI